MQWCCHVTQRVGQRIRKCPIATRLQPLADSAIEQHRNYRMRKLNRRKLISAIALCALLIFGWVSQFGPTLLQGNWAIGWKLAFGVAVCATFLATFYDKRNLPKKLWDLNPRRGLLYFLLGWLIFPVMIGIEAISGSNFELTEMVLITLGMSALIGIAGTFTENVGI